MLNKGLPVMTKHIPIRFIFVIAMLCMLAGLVWSTSSFAVDLSTAKAQGLVGEQPDGYLGLVKPDAGGDVKAMMNDINSARKNEYQAIAKRNNTDLNVIEKLAGKKAIEKTPAGQFVKLREAG